MSLNETWERQREIERLKRQGRAALLAYRQIAAGAPCGNALLQTISGPAARHARDFDAAMARLRELDPNCPPCEPLSVA